MLTNTERDFVIETIKELALGPFDDENGYFAEEAEQAIEILEKLKAIELPSP